MSDERVPQRFRYRHKNDKWRCGVCMPYNSGWRVVFVGGISEFRGDDPWRGLSCFLKGDYKFEWIDNDYGWPNKPKSDVEELAERVFEGLVKFTGSPDEHVSVISWRSDSGTSYGMSNRGVAIQRIAEVLKEHLKGDGEYAN